MVTKTNLKINTRSLASKTRRTCFWSEVAGTSNQVDEFESGTFLDYKCFFPESFKINMK